MFEDNKYTRWYHAICDRARFRERPAVMERHHVVPRCMGGTDDGGNIVALTIREHLLVHRMLIKMTSGRTRHRLTYAYLQMVHGWQGKLARVPLHEVMRIRQEYGQRQREFQTGRKFKLSPEGLRNIQEAAGRRRGSRLSDETRQRMSESGRGRPKSDQFKAHISKILTGRPKPYMQLVNRDPEKIRKTADAHRGMKRTDEARRNMSRAGKGRIVKNKGMRWIHSLEGVRRFITSDETVPEGFYVGYGPRVSQKHVL